MRYQYALNINFKILFDAQAFLVAQSTVCILAIEPIKKRNENYYGYLVSSTQTQELKYSRGFT